MNREELIELYWNKGLSIGEIDRFISWLNPCIKNSIEFKS